MVSQGGSSGSSAVRPGSVKKQFVNVDIKRFVVTGSSGSSIFKSKGGTQSDGQRIQRYIHLF